MQMSSKIKWATLRDYIVTLNGDNNYVVDLREGINVSDIPNRPAMSIITDIYSRKVINTYRAPNGVLHIVVE